MTTTQQRVAPQLAGARAPFVGGELPVCLTAWDGVRTVDAWHARFEARWDEAVDLVGKEVAPLWRLYLVGASMAFREGHMGVDQILAVRPGHDGAAVEPVRPASWS